MTERKICLFTAHSPMVGGGGVIIRSLMENLPELSISWKYLADAPVPGYEDGFMGKGIKGTGLAREMLHSFQMLSGASCTVIDELVAALLAVECDAYWIVSHNEGLRIGLELTRLQQERPVHLTFHDDWAGALCARSMRYRFANGLALRLTISALQQASSFDVISNGMQKYYKHISGRDGEICHRYLSENSVLDNHVTDINETWEVNVGHIGSIYDKNDFLSFVALFTEFVHQSGRKPFLHMWGCHLTTKDIPEAFRENIVFHAELPESDVVPLLARCRFVYAMYPFAQRLSRFSMTSLPTKLTSYVQAGRPIFGHGPSDSTLADFLRDTNSGVIWSDRNKHSGMLALSKIMALHPTARQWQMTREKYFGEKNLATIRKALLAQA